MTEGPETQASAGRFDASYAKYMDHTVLKPETTRETVKRMLQTTRVIQGILQHARVD